MVQDIPTPMSVSIKDSPRQPIEMLHAYLAPPSLLVGAEPSENGHTSYCIGRKAALVSFIRSRGPPRCRTQHVLLVPQGQSLAFD